MKLGDTVFASDIVACCLLLVADILGNQFAAVTCNNYKFCSLGYGVILLMECLLE